MDAMRSSKKWLIVAAWVGIAFCALVAVLVWPQPPLSGLESRCVGSWAFLPSDKPSTLIVYHFEEKRSVREEHYYLTSATPTVPRIKMVGQWRVESNGRMVVEPRGGLEGLGDAGSGLIREVLDDDGHLARPVLRRFYRIDSATAQGLSVRSGDQDFVMRPFQSLENLSTKSQYAFGR